jgi:hypothetical protein
MLADKTAVSRQFETALERVRWAQEDALELKSLARQFFTSNTHKRVCELDVDGINYVDKITFNQQLPPRIARLTVSAIENLRSALDHGACAVVPRAAKKGTYFPFGDTRREFKRHLKSKAKHVPPEIQALFVSMKPYRRGNPPLWALNKIANTHKHRTIVRPGIDVKEFRFTTSGPHTGLNAVLRNSQPRWDRGKNEIVISRVGGETTMQHDIDALLGVAFGKVPIYGGRPVSACLRATARMVEKILWVMESEAKKIGIIK